jgi:hypothetical protein
MGKLLGKRSEWSDTPLLTVRIPYIYGEFVDLTIISSSSALLTIRAVLYRAVRILIAIAGACSALIVRCY